MAIIILAGLVLLAELVLLVVLVLLGVVLVIETPMENLLILAISANQPLVTRSPALC